MFRFFGIFRDSPEPVWHGRIFTGGSKLGCEEAYQDMLDFKNYLNDAGLKPEHIIENHTTLLFYEGDKQYSRVYFIISYFFNKEIEYTSQR
jgi:hypothetical protein